MKTRGYFAADTINGVYFFGEVLEDGEATVLIPRDFADSLKNLEDDEVIYAFFDAQDSKVMREIDEEYGVKN